MGTRFRSKVSAAAVKFVPDGVEIVAVRHDSKWLAKVTGYGHVGSAVASGLMDCMQKAMAAWHKEKGTDLKALVREAEKKREEESVK